MSIFGQVWLWSIAAFVLGALLTWILLVRPAHARARELERELARSRSEPVGAPNGAAGYSGRPEHSGPPEYLDRVDYANDADYTDNVAYADNVGHTAEFSVTETAPEHSGYYEQAPAQPESSRALFQPALPTTADEQPIDHPPSDEQPIGEPRYDPVAEPQLAEPERAESERAEPYVGDTEAGTEVLPKRRPGQAPRGGFDAPEPVRPSMRAMARREPAHAEAAHSGSLFEPSVPEGETDGGHVSGGRTGENPDATAEPRAVSANGSAEPGVGPFGPGSAMPLPGGAQPSEDFQVKASVTTLRYCPRENPQYPDMVAEVWFRAAEDAERVGFRPID